MPNPISQAPEESRKRGQKRGASPKKARKKAARKKSASKKKSARKKKTAAAEPEQSASEAEVPSDALAAFALLADPNQIAGEASPVVTPDAGSELAPVVTPDAGPESAPVATPDAAPELPAVVAPVDRIEAPRPSVAAPSAGNRKLLDASAARKLAAEARERERESRAALEATRKALGFATPEAPSSPSEYEPTTTDSTRPEREPASKAHPRPLLDDAGWNRLPLVAREAQALPETETTQTPPPDAEPRHDTSKAMPDAARAYRHAEDTQRLAGLERELAETRAEMEAQASALATATERERELSEQLEARSGELNALIDQIAQRESTIEERDRRIESLEAATAQVAESSNEPTEAEQAAEEIRLLRKRIAGLDTELAERDGERNRLEAALADRDALDAVRRDQLDSLRDRLEAQDRALDASRREHESERQRHTRSLDLLDRLRASLAEAGEALAESTGPLSHETERGEANRAGSRTEIGDTYTYAPQIGPADDGPHVRAAGSSLGVMPGAGALELPSTAIRQVDRVEPAGTTLRSNEPQRLASSEDRSRHVFSHWLDTQIRRQFGPIGIDRWTDLLRAPLARRRSSMERPASILALGQGVRDLAPELATALVTTGPDHFVVHTADTEAPLAIPSATTESPLQTLLSAAPAPSDPDALDALIQTTRPDVILCHSLLTPTADPARWLEVLADAHERRVALVFVERSGLPVTMPPEPIGLVGDRIWSLMPSRYTQHPDGWSHSTWREAFAACPASPANALSEQLRVRFRPELSAQFGFLIEPFLRSGIAGNFDVTAERDRRFLAQVSEVDERRLEAGETSGLYCVARIDPLAEH